MASLLEQLTELPEEALAEAIGFALGAAAGAALTPAGTAIVQPAWQLTPIKVHDPPSIALLIAQGLASFQSLVTEAEQNGMNSDRLAQLVQTTYTGPDLATLLSMLRRGTITEQQFQAGVAKLMQDPQWLPAQMEQQTARLSPADLALMVQRGLIPDQGILPVAAPTTAGSVPSFPVFNIDAYKEAASAGFDMERFAALVGTTGLSIGPVQAAQGYYRGTLQLVDYHRAIAEGDVRNEWADPLLEISREIPTAPAFAEGQIRGQITAAQRSAGTALHGMAQEHSDLLYEISGRGLSPKAVTTALERGGTFPGSYDNVPEPYKGSIQRALTREEYAELAYANRYTLPSPFLIRTLATTGEIDSTTASDLLLQSGWPPDLVALVVKSWFGGTATTADKHVAKAQTQLWNTTHKAYLVSSITESDAAAALTAAGVLDAAVPSVLAVWQHERGIVRKELSPAEIVKSHADKAVNPATGVPWTTDDAIVALQDRGYSPDAALNLLEI